MLRLTQLIRETLSGEPVRPFGGRILIWNLTRACNLTCKHCYASAGTDRAGELSTAEALALIPGLVEAKVRIAILSGGEPLIRKDLFEIATALSDVGIVPYLSTNGLLVRQENLPAIQAAFRYIGISIDGRPEIHDAFRGKRGAFRQSIDALRLCRDAGLRVGMRFTLTAETRNSLPFIMNLLETEHLPKLYVSHLVYSGRGGELAGVEHEQARDCVSQLVDRAFDHVEAGAKHEIVTGNNEADAVILVREFARRHPEHAADLRERLRAWGGNQAGERLLNIDARGNLRPDPFFTRTLGNVRESSVSVLLAGSALAAQLRNRRDHLGGRCGVCPEVDICNGNSRARAQAIHQDIFAEDPACYV